MPSFALPGMGRSHLRGACLGEMFVLRGTGIIRSLIYRMYVSVDSAGFCGYSGQGKRHEATITTSSVCILDSVSIFEWRLKSISPSASFLAA